MAIIIQAKNQILREKAKEVPFKDIGSEKLKKILGEMTGALYTAKDGVALAAPQIGIPLRIFIVKKEILNRKADAQIKPIIISPLVFINPKIIKMSKKKQTVNEGCLSVNGVYGTIKRAEKLTVEALDEKGRKFTRGASGFMAQIIQHEIDHLNGVLFIDEATNLLKTRKEN